MNNETRQQIFASTITDIIAQAYASGLLQYDPMVIMGITVKMEMFTHFNTLNVQFNGNTLTTAIWDSDNEQVQYSSIQNLVADIITPR